MRSQRRHNRKLTSLAQELRGEEASLESHSEAENWKDALSHLEESLDRLSRAERDVLCARFFEEKSYREIAQNFGKSEAACKIQVKRTIAKLNQWLTARGSDSFFDGAWLGIERRDEQSSPCYFGGEFAGEGDGRSFGHEWRQCSRSAIFLSYEFNKDNDAGDSNFGSGRNSHCFSAFSSERSTAAVGGVGEEGSRFGPTTS